MKSLTPLCFILLLSLYSFALELIMRQSFLFAQSSTQTKAHRSFKISLNLCERELMLNNGFNFIENARYVYILTKAYSTRGMHCLKLKTN